MAAAAVSAVVLDIEGTTTPISFVHDVLFPYARKHLKEYIANEWKQPALLEYVNLLRSEASSEVSSLGADAVADSQPALIPEESSATLTTVQNAVIGYCMYLMKSDRKSTALKGIQGLLWKSGYASGSLRSIVFDDVPVALRAWKSAGVPVYIYSSGSIVAQQLLFGHTEGGDLLDLLSGHFDTTTGPKTDASSYTKILDEIKQKAEGVLFVTDNVKEAAAATEAGMQVAVADRPGNAPLSDEDAEKYRVVKSFDELGAGPDTKRARTENE